jgi:hypothetical protein
MSMSLAQPRHFGGRISHPSGRPWASSLLAGVGLLVALVGCSSKPLEPVPVSGKVEYQGGKPVGVVMLAFHPQDDSNKKTFPTTETDKDGKFSFTCLKGRYKVTIAAIPKGHASADAPDSGGLAVPKKGQPEFGPLSAYQRLDKTPWEIDVPDTGKQNLVLTVR